MERIEKLSEIIVNHSIKVKENEKVLITYQSNKSMPLVRALVEDILKHKGIPTIKYIDPDSFVSQSTFMGFYVNVFDNIKLKKTRQVAVFFLLWAFEMISMASFYCIRLSKSFQGLKVFVWGFEYQYYLTLSDAQIAFMVSSWLYP